MALDWLWKHPSKGSPSDEVKYIHEYDDCDKHPDAHHHTLGRGEFQAAPGNHTHLRDITIKGKVADGTLLLALLEVLEKEMGLIVEIEE